MLAHKQEYEFFLADAQGFPGVGKVGVRIIGHQVAAVFHHLHGPLKAVFANNFHHRFLRHPHLVGLLEELHGYLEHLVHHKVGGDDFGIIVPKLGVEGGHQGDVLLLGHGGRHPARGERGMGMHQFELALGKPG